MKQIQILSEAAWNICTPNDLRTYMRLDSGETDDVLNHYIKTATSLFETTTYYILQQKHYQVTYDDPDQVIFPIDHRPLKNILSVYRDERLLQPDQYVVKANKIYLDDYSDYPLMIEYIAGFESVSDVPLSLRHILMMCAADLYLYRLSHDQNYGFTERINNIIQLYADKSL